MTKSRGGRRPGSGRKRKQLLITRRATAESVLNGIDEERVWHGLLDDKDSRVRLESMKYLTNRRDGTPQQSMALTGADGEALVPFAGPIPSLMVFFNPNLAPGVDRATYECGPIIDTRPKRPKLPEPR